MQERAMKQGTDSATLIAYNRKKQEFLKEIVKKCNVFKDFIIVAAILQLCFELLILHSYARNNSQNTTNTS